MIIIWIIVAILMFSIIILIHEWWHFAAARKFGVKVEEFWLGIPPRAKKLFKDKKWTLFSLNRLPLWGFVKLSWESPNTFLVYNKSWILYNNQDLEKDIKKWKDIFLKSWDKLWESDKNKILEKIKENKADYNLMNKKTWQQAIIILAWVFMNFLLAAFIFSVLFFIWIKPLWINTKIETDLNLKLIPTYEQAIESGLLIKNLGVILSPVEWSIAEKSNLKEWDILYEVHTCETKMLNHVICSWWEEAKIQYINNPSDLINILKNNAWTDVAFFTNARILNNEEKEIYKTDYLGWAYIKVSIPENGKVWTYVSENIELNTDFKYKYNLIDSIKYGFSETYNQILLTFKWIWILIKKIFNPETPEERQEAISQVSWPIWIVDFISNSMEWWIIFIIIIWAIISINLWVFNLLPIPALDWWRFIFITINGLIKKIFWRKAISEKTEWLIHVWFFIVLIALSLLIAYNDINKIIIR